MSLIVVILVLILVAMGIVILGYFIDLMFNRLEYTNKIKKLTQTPTTIRKPASHLSVARTLEKAKPKNQRITAKNSEL
jgi:predicted PurR-regulated permease PerM|tara:strand:+ start:4975 stop:5208 length:234 start_codon:yes stop_codon:yes gene_type:complete